MTPLFESESRAGATASSPEVVSVWAVAWVSSTVAFARAAFASPDGPFLALAIDPVTPANVYAGAHPTLAPTAASCPFGVESAKVVPSPP